MSECVDAERRESFSQTSPHGIMGTAFRDGRMISRADAEPFQDKQYKVWVATDFHPERALGFKVTANVRVVFASIEAWVAVPLTAYADVGIKLELRVTRRSTGDLIGMDQVVIASRNTPAFRVGTDVVPGNHVLTCTGELGEEEGGVKAEVILYVWATAAGIAGAAAQVDVNVDAITLERCCVRPLEAPTGMVPLFSWWSHHRGDNFLTSQAAWAGCDGSVRFPHPDRYIFVQFAGFAFDPAAAAPPHTVPLFHWWNPDRQDNFVTSDPRWGVSAQIKMAIIDSVLKASFTIRDGRNHQVLHLCSVGGIPIYKTTLQPLIQYGRCPLTTLCGMESI
jgi:hypothetical protein